MKKILLTALTITTFVFAQGKALYTIDFTKHKDGDAKAWLKSKGFEFLLDSKKISMYFSQGKLIFETKKKKAGLIGVRFKKPMNAKTASIEWGVEKFPKGANWSRGNNRVAIGAFFLLGTKKFSSGVPFVKSAPYFLGPFIGKKETPGKKYVGKLYKKSGCYYCVANHAGTVHTHFNIDKKFQQAFHKKSPPLTAFGLQMNTNDTKGGAKAFIKRITFYE